MAATSTHHPKNVKNCVFCKYWIGDADMQFVNSVVGYKYLSGAKGKCSKRNGAVFPAVYKCNYYMPSIEAERLL